MLNCLWIWVNVNICLHATLKDWTKFSGDMNMSNPQFTMLINLFILAKNLYGKINESALGSFQSLFVIKSKCEWFVLLLCLYFVSSYGDPLLRDWSRVVAYFIRDQWTCLNFLQKFAETPRATGAFHAAIEALSLLPSDLVLPVLDFMCAALPQVTTYHSLFSILLWLKAGDPLYVNSNICY